MHKGTHTNLPETALSAAKPGTQTPPGPPRPSVEKTIPPHHVKTIRKAPAILTQGIPECSTLSF